jgi:hypothetical protein
MELALYLAEKAVEFQRLASLALSPAQAAELMSIAETLSLNAAERLGATVLDAADRSTMVRVAYQYLMCASMSGGGELQY